MSTLPPGIVHVDQREILTRKGQKGTVKIGSDTQEGLKATNAFLDRLRDAGYLKDRTDR